MSDHHFPCPCGKELSDECPDCARTNPLGSMRIEAPIGSDAPMTATPSGIVMEIRYGADGEPLVLLTKGKAVRRFSRDLLLGILDYLRLTGLTGTWSLGPGLPSLDEYDVRAAIAYLDEHTETTP